MQNRTEILRKYIKNLKKQRKITDDSLATEIGVSIRQFSRWMNGDNIPEKHHENIANALMLDLSTLKGESDLNSHDRAHNDNAKLKLFRFSSSVSQYSMNGYSLIETRFGLSKSEIVEWAPALFYLIASQSIEDLQLWVDAYQEKLENAPEGFAPNEDYLLDYKNKREMLDTRDVLGKHFGRTFDHARIPFIDTFIKLANSQRNEISPDYFGDIDLEGHLPRARVLLDWATCLKLARNDEALASAIQDASIMCPKDESDEAFKMVQSTFEDFLKQYREFEHKRRKSYEQTKEQSSDELKQPQTTYFKKRSFEPTRAWQAKLWSELDHKYGEYQWPLLDEGSIL